MSIKQNGGVFGRNPTFNDVTIEGDLIINGEVFTGLDFQGSWNASTNSPALASSTGTHGEFYIVSVAGATDLNGITNWGIGDWALFNGTVWQRVEGGADGNFNDLTVAGTSVLTGNVGIGTNSSTAPLTILSTGWEHLNLVSSDSNSTNKTGYVTVGHYTNAQESFGIISGQSTSSSNVLKVGGGAAGLNAATSINLYTAANNTTVTGTPRVSIDYSGNTEIATGNLIIGTSGKGIDFSATAGTGTSEVLDDYEEGTWTPTAADAISGGTTSTTGSGSYTKIGNFIMVTAALVNIDTTGMTAGNTFHIQGLPFASGDVPLATAYFINSGVFTSAVTTASPVQSWINDTGVSALYFYDSSGAILVSDITSGAGDFYFTAIYQTA